MICLYSINICSNIFIPYEIFYFFWNMLNPKTIKVCYIIIINIQSNPMSFYLFILIKIYYLCLILYFRKLISSIKAIKFRFIFIIILYFKISYRMGQHLKISSALIAPSPALIVPLLMKSFLIN